MSDEEHNSVDFYTHFDANLAKILKFRELMSGKHGVDYDKADLWATSQLNPQRRRVARNFIHNIHYITFDQVIQSVKSLITDIYKKIPMDEHVYLLVGYKNSSFYFMGVIAIHFIRLMGYSDPEILYMDDAHDVNSFENKVNVLIIDDMSYTGIQLEGIYNTIMYNGRKEIYNNIQD